MVKKQQLMEQVHVELLVGKLARIYWLKIILSASLFISILLSLKLWVSNRYYPSSPVLDILPTIPYPFDYLLLLVLLITILLVLLLPRPQKLIFFLIVLSVFLIILDQSRMQVWFYQFLLMFFLLSFYNWKSDASGYIEKIIKSFQFLTAFMYVWSGVLKFNYFFPESFSYWLRPLERLIPEISKTIPHEFWVAMPIYELSLGILLLTRFRKLGVVMAFLMHFYILYVLGPFGHNYNNIVWLWNITMMLLLIILFWNNTYIPLSGMFKKNNLPFYSIVIVLIGILPALCPLGLWDSHLSFSLYTNSIDHATIYFRSPIMEKVPSGIRPLLKNTHRGYHWVNLNTWSFHEMNVPAYPEKRIFMSVGKQLCSLARQPDDIIMVVKEKKIFYYKTPKTLIYNCEQLL